MGGSVECRFDDAGFNTIGLIFIPRVRSLRLRENRLIALINGIVSNRGRANIQKSRHGGKNASKHCYLFDPRGFADVLISSRLDPRFDLVDDGRNIFLYHHSGYLKNND